MLIIQICRISTQSMIPKVGFFIPIINECKGLELYGQHVYLYDMATKFSFPLFVLFLNNKICF